MGKIQEFIKLLIRPLLTFWMFLMIIKDQINGMTEKENFYDSENVR